MNNIFYIGNNFKVSDSDGKLYKITNISNLNITLDDYLVLTYEQFKKCFKCEKIIVY